MSACGTGSVIECHPPVTCKHTSNNHYNLTCLKIFQTAANSAFSSCLCKYKQPAVQRQKSIRPAYGTTDRAAVFASENLLRDTHLLFPYPSSALTYRKIGPVGLVDVGFHWEVLAVFVFFNKHRLLRKLTSRRHTLPQQK